MPETLAMNSPMWVGKVDCHLEPANVTVTY